MRFLVFLSFLLIINSESYGQPHGQLQGHTYECRKENHHVIHIVTIDPQKYTLAFVKARNQVVGRETINEIAKRTGADIAINAGFFEIGRSQDGMPSGTLIINDQIFGLSFKEHDCLINESKGLTIQNIKPTLEINVGKNKIIPNKMNRLSTRDDVILYSHVWGPRTLTPLKERQEISINPQGKVVEFVPQGNCAIPQEGFVISLPQSHKLESIKSGDTITFRLEPAFLAKPDKISAVMGIPLLLKEGNISAKVLNDKSSFATFSHARTAIGTRPDGKIVIIVAEESAQDKPLDEVKLGDVQSILDNHKEEIVQKYKKTSLNSLSLGELKEIIKSTLTPGSTRGLSLLELAQLMKDLGCTSAINLDGGGSSSLYINDQVVNHPVGDKDESQGQSVLRPLSDAIVFKRMP